jgi:tellurite resistance protein TehA-like permease
LGLFIDFASRFFHGAPISLIGSIGNVLIGNREPNFKAGVPKQFATFIGAFMSGLAAILYRWGHQPARIVGAILLAILGLFCGLEGFANWCCGCWIFGLLMDWGIVPKTLYQVHLNSKAEKADAWRRQHVFNNPPCPNFSTHTPEGFPRSKTDLRARRRTFEQRWEDFHPIRHFDSTQFSSTMATAALAILYKFANEEFRGFPFGDRAGEHMLPIDAAVWQTIGILAAIHFLIFFILWSLKAIISPSKIYKEWYHPVKSIGIFTMLSTPQLLAYLLKDDARRFAKALFWITAPIQLVLSILKLSESITTSTPGIHLHAGWLMTPMVNMISALVIVSVYDPHGQLFTAGPVQPWFYEVAWLWFSFALICYLAGWAITLQQGMSSAHTIPDLRQTVWVWVAAPAIIAVAYFKISNQFDNFFRFWWYSALCLFITIVFTCRTRFLELPKFSMAAWLYVFPIEALTLACFIYDFFVQGATTRVLSIIFLYISTFLVFIMLFQTVASIIKKEIWRPEERSGPLTFMLMTHEAFRAAIPKLGAMVEKLDPSGSTGVKGFADMFIGLANAYEVHSMHEEKVIMPYLDRYFPGVGQNRAHEEHETEHRTIHSLVRVTSALLADGTVPVARDSNGSGLVIDLVNGIDTRVPSDQLIAYIQTTFPKLGEAMLAHLANEEATFTQIVAKHLPQADQSRLNEDCWEQTENSKLACYLCWVVNNLPIPTWRQTFLRSWYGTFPERAQLIGLIIYRGVQNWMWALLVDDIPEIIPRGLPGWRPYH